MIPKSTSTDRSADLESSRPFPNRTSVRSAHILIQPEAPGRCLCPGRYSSCEWTCSRPPQRREAATSSFFKSSVQADALSVAFAMQAISPFDGPIPIVIKHSIAEVPPDFRLPTPPVRAILQATSLGCQKFTSVFSDLPKASRSKMNLKTLLFPCRMLFSLESSTHQGVQT